jgi:hypothetical protein
MICLAIQTRVQSQRVMKQLYKIDLTNYPLGSAIRSLPTVISRLLLYGFGHNAYHT